MCWWVDKDVTLFLPIQTLQMMKTLEYKSVRYDILDTTDWVVVPILGKKKRVFFDYDMEKFLKIMEDAQRRIICQTLDRKK